MITPKLFKKRKIEGGCRVFHKQ